MNTAAIYQEIVEKEREATNKKLVVILLARPQSPEARALIEDFQYMHFNSGGYCNIYAVGFSDDENRINDVSFHGVTLVNNSHWYYSDQAFNDLKEYLRYILNLDYSGESAVIILQNNPGNTEPLNFDGCVYIDLTTAIRRYDFSFARFMEYLLFCARNRYEKNYRELDDCYIDVERITEEAFYKCVAEIPYRQCIRKVEKGSNNPSDFQ